MPAIGPMEIMIVILIALAVFGPRQLPKIAGKLGASVKELRSTVAGINEASTDVAVAANAHLTQAADEVAKVAVSEADDAQT